MSDLEAYEVLHQNDRLKMIAETSEENDRIDSRTLAEKLSNEYCK
jgi:hypothetical protein